MYPKNIYIPFNSCLSHSLDRHHEKVSFQHNACESIFEILGFEGFYSILKKNIRVVCLGHLGCGERVGCVLSVLDGECVKSWCDEHEQALLTDRCRALPCNLGSYQCVCVIIDVRIRCSKVLSSVKTSG